MANTTAIPNLAARQKANISPQSCPTILVNSYTSCQEFSGFCARQRNRHQKHQAGFPLHYEFSLESPPTGCCYLNNGSMLAARLFYHLKTLVICGLMLKIERDSRWGRKVQFLTKQKRQGNLNLYLLVCFVVLPGKDSSQRLLFSRRGGGYKKRGFSPS